MGYENKTRVWVDSGNYDVFDKRTARRMSDKEVTIASPYRRIDNEAMKNNIKMRILILGNSVKEIGTEAFSRCTNLRNVYLNGVRTIQKGAFFGCSNLKELKIPQSVQYLEKYAFMENKGIRQISYEPENRSTVLSSDLFRECNRLRQIILPRHLAEIRGGAFYRCKELDGIIFPNSVKRIGKEAFYGNGMTSLDLPEGLLEIEDSAFFKCNQLEYVCIPRSVKILGKWVFHGCNRLKVLEIPEDPEVIGPWIINRSCIIRCKKDGRVDQYCQEYGFSVEYL